MRENIFSFLPLEIIRYIFAFDSHIIFRDNKWIFIHKILENDFRYAMLLQKIIITKSVRYVNTYPSLYLEDDTRNKIVLKKQKDISKIIIYDKSFTSDNEFSHYLYKTIQMYKYF
jgi:hypothetical protein